MNFAARASPWQREYDDENGQGSRPPLVSSIWHLGLSLSGVETQDLRRLIKRCYLCLNAIHDPKSPALLETVLPLAFQSSSVLHGLLALSKASKSRSETDLSRHQMALGQLVAEIGATNPGPIDAIHAQRALASSLLLSIFAVGSCDGSWCHHVRGMVSILRSTDRASLTSQPTGRFLVGICAFSDISALSVGRRRLSQKAWLSWMTPRPSQDCDSASASFSALESTVGYPESLIDLLAQAAERADDNVHAHPKFSNSASSPASGLDTLGYPWSSQELEASLKSWSPPELPRHMSSYEQLAVRTFWSAIRKACLLFLWRGRGFHSNLAERQPGGRSAESQGLVREVLLDLRITLDLCRTQQLSIATAMMWPLAVVGAESCHATRQDQSEVLALLQGLAELFSMSQALRLSSVLSQLWDRTSQCASQFTSLEMVCRDMNLVISFA